MLRLIKQKSKLSLKRKYSNRIRRITILSLLLVIFIVSNISGQDRQPIDYQIGAYNGTDTETHKLVGNSDELLSDTMSKESSIPLFQILLFFILSSFLLYFTLNILRKSKEDPLAYHFSSKGAKNMGIIAVTLLISIISLAALIFLNRIEIKIKQNSRTALKTVLQTTDEGLKIWAHHNLENLNIYAENPIIIKSTKELLEGPRSKEILLKSSNQNILRQFFKNYLNRSDFRGFFIVAPDSTSLSSMRDSNIGTKNIIALKRSDLFTRVLNGNSLFIPPLRSDVVIDSEKGVGTPTCFFAAPIKNKSDNIIAVLIIRIDPSQDFTLITQTGRIGETGETYAFDRDAMLITESRFDDQLRDSGLIDKDQKGIMNIHIRVPVNGKNNPGINPLTMMAEHATRGENGYNTDCYYDYRGTMVIGAWLWDEELNIGLATEIDQAEVIKTYFYIRNSIFALSGITLTLFIISVLFSFYLEDKADKELKKANSNLEQKIEERTKKLSESEIKFRTLADYTYDWEYWIQPDGHYKYISPSCKNISGYTSDEFNDKPDLFFQIIHPEFKDEVKSHFDQESLNNEGFSKVEFILISKDGEHKWIEHSCIPIFNDSGQFLGRRGTNRDITDRKKYEEELKKFNVLVDQSPFSIVMTDLEGNIEYVNPHFENITGYGFNEALGQNTRILKSDNTDPELYKNLWDTITTGRSWKGEFQNKNKTGGFFWESATITPLINQRGQIFQYLAIKENITDKKLLENQLHQSQKMEAIGQFAGGIAHDFNNILTAILGFAEIGLMDKKEDMILNNIQSSSLRAASLVKKLLGFSRKQIIDPLVIDVKHLVDDLEKMLNRMIGEEIKIIKSYKDNIPLIFADPGQIEQIIINLVINARDAINSKDKQVDKPLININLDTVNIQTVKKENMYEIPKGHYLIMSVSDTGSGMDKETQKKIFEPFFTTKEEGKGTGLGLATAYGIIKQNNGYINVYSEIGIGTTFRIYWPVFKNFKTVETDSRETKVTLTGTESIVLIEDDKDIVTMVEKGLTKLGYKVISYSDPDIALEEIPKLDVDIDLLISDVILPNMNGKVFTDKLSLILPDLKILYTSGYTDDHIVNAGILKKDVNFISKPFNLIELTKKIKYITG
ncbi:MAG: PAS domain S-box protein [Candidatus Marinimicrobia bacterium]|nr:PAS domain S-box protein [Candidatus Neomarinimicrobiota bacterium]